MTMKTETMRERMVRTCKERPALLIGGALVALVVIGGVLLSGGGQAPAPTSYYEVRRGDFLVSIVEGGSLEAVREVAVRSEVEGTARIIDIVPEGTYVRRDDLIVELDSAQAQDSVSQQLITVERAQFALTQAEEQLEIQKSIVDSEVRAAELKVEFAAVDLKRYREGEYLQNLRQAEADIMSIRENLSINIERAERSRELMEQGFETKRTADSDELAALQSRLSLDRATNNLWMLNEFDHPRRERQLAAALDEARDELERVKMQGQRRLLQYEADVITQRNTLALNQAKLERDQRQLAASRIYAPQDGLVVYPVSGNRFSSESLIEPGATIRNRQEIIKLPDVDEMKLSIRVHESQVNMVRVGQPAFVVLDSMPDLRLQGVVSRVGLLPDASSRWANPNLKVYLTDILITSPLPDVKPGVSARAEIVVTNLHDVLTVPMQAVTTRSGAPVVYVAQGRTSVPVPVEVGMYNTRFIQLTAGVQEGDRVLLAPPFDTEDQDMSGAILAAAEIRAMTNLNAALPQTALRGGTARPAETIPTSGVAENRPADGSGPVPGAGPGSRTQPGVAEATPRGPRMGREEMLRRFDTDGDGQLSDSERAVMIETLAAEGVSFPQGGPGGARGERGERVGRPEGGAGFGGAGGGRPVVETQ
jgi:HlyD family secretion protein